MSNEVKQIFLTEWDRHDLSSLPTSVIYKILDQFEGMKLVKDSVSDPKVSGPMCYRCGNDLGLSKGHIYHNNDTRWNELLCKSCFDAQCPEPAAKPKFDYKYRGGILNSKTQQTKWKDVPAEPEPWAELKAAADREGYEPHIVAYRFEAAWKEQERRTSRMIAEAIKAERAHLAIIADDEGMCGMARVFKRASK